jgi:hypothetical protein
MDTPQHVGDLLQAFAERGVFRGFSRQRETRQQGEFRVRWHRDQVFQWGYDRRRRSIRVASVLPAVPPGSAMDRDFRQWLRARQDRALPAHRRYDPARLGLRAYNRGGEVTLTVRVLDDDMDYGVRRTVSLVNEIYLDFINRGPYFDWLLETFELDPDNPY